MRSDWLVRYFKTIFPPLFSWTKLRRKCQGPLYPIRWCLSRASARTIFTPEDMSLLWLVWISRHIWHLLTLLWNPNNREMTRLSRGNFDRIPLWWINYSNTIWEDIILYKFGCLLINYTILYYIQIKVLYSQDLPFKIFTNTIVSRKIRKRIFRCDSWRKRGQAETGGG